MLWESAGDASKIFKDNAKLFPKMKGVCTIASLDPEPARTPSDLDLVPRPEVRQVRDFGCRSFQWTCKYVCVRTCDCGLRSLYRPRPTPGRALSALRHVININ